MKGQLILMVFLEPRFYLQAIIDSPQSLITQARRTCAVKLFDAQPIGVVYDSHSKRFRQAGLTPFTYQQYIALLLQKDLDRSHKPVDLAAIEGNSINEIDTIRLLQENGLIEDLRRWKSSLIIV